MYHKDIGSCEMYRHKTNARVQIPEGEKFMNERNVRPFSKRDEIGYVFGDMAGSFVNLFVDAYFLTFCTYVLGISPAWMGSLFLAARLWDAVNDPIMGSFPDRWMLGKSGDKFKPWIKIFMIPLALSGVLCFPKCRLKVLHFMRGSLLCMSYME